MQSTMRSDSQYRAEFVSLNWLRPCVVIDVSVGDWLDKRNITRGAGGDGGHPGAGRERLVALQSQRRFLGWGTPAVQEAAIFI